MALLAERTRAARRRSLLLLPLTAAFLIGAGCSKEDTATAGAQPVALKKGKEAEDAIRNNPALSDADKQKYLRQLEENRMAEKMNPNTGGSAVGAAAATENAGPPPPGS